MNERFCVLEIDGKDAEVHWFRVIDDATWNYTIRSLNAFNQRERMLWSERTETLPRRGSMYFAADFEMMPYLHDLPSFNHADLWALYLAIKYDYKAKKYVA